MRTRSAHTSGTADPVRWTPPARRASGAVRRPRRPPDREIWHDAILSTRDPGLVAVHVEQPGYQPVQAVGLAVDQAVQLPSFVGREVLLGFEQRARRHLHGRQRGAQVVGDGAQEGAPHAVALLQELGPQRLVPELGPLDGEGRLIDEDAEEIGVDGAPRQAPHGEQADRTTGGDQGHRPQGPGPGHRPGTDGMTGIPESGRRSFSSASVGTRPDPTATSSRSPRGRSRAAPSTSNALLTVSTMRCSSSVSDRSLTSNSSESSSRRRGLYRLGAGLRPGRPVAG